MSTVRIAIVGVGNCASSLVQGLEYYKDADPETRVPGLMHVELGGYHVRDVQVVAAFDVDARRSATMSPRRSSPSRTTRSGSPTCRPPASRSNAAERWTGSAPTTARLITESDQPEADVVQVLRDTGADVLVCYLPVGSEQADRSSTRSARSTPASASSTACPVFIASTPSGRRSSPTRACPSSATTSSSQVGATITHRVLTKLFEDRGVKLNRTYQLNFGGNMDFMNMLERERLTSRRRSPRRSRCSSQLEKPLDKERDPHRALATTCRGSRIASGR